MMVDLTGMDVPALRALLDDVYVEIKRQSFVDTAEQTAHELNRNYLVATGARQGEPWVQPTGYLNVYPESWRVTHDEKEWISNYNGNDQEPGVRGWREDVGEGEYPEFVKPVGYEDAYNTGDRVMFEDAAYECLEDGTTWSPTETPARWELIEDDEPAE